MTVLAACDAASISTVLPDGFVTRAATDELAGVLDAIQYRTGDGPCVRAIETGAVSRVPGSGGSEQSGAFWAAAQQRGLQAAMSVPVVTGEQVAGSLNLYGCSGDAPFGAADEAIGSLLAEAAGRILAAEEESVRQEQLVEQLNQALASRDIIGQAKGILMAREGCTADQAFDMLRRASQRMNQKLRDVAEQIAASATTGPSGTHGGQTHHRG